MPLGKEALALKVVSLPVSAIGVDVGVTIGVLVCTTL